MFLDDVGKGCAAAGKMLLCFTFYMETTVHYGIYTDDTHITRKNITSTSTHEEYKLFSVFKSKHVHCTHSTIKFLSLSVVTSNSDYVEKNAFPLSISALYGK